MAHVVWYENMELIIKEKKHLFYSEAQTEQKYAIYCRCCYLYGQMKFWACNVNGDIYAYELSLYISQ